jgi:magnesium transporter
MAFFYLSQVLGRPVCTRSGERVARVKDLVAQLQRHNAGDVVSEPYPPISGLVVDLHHRQIFIPWRHVASFDREGVRLSSSQIDLDQFERREGEALLARDILDKQLVDIDGRRVIRANDLLLYGEADVVRVTAVDVSGEALVRRLTFGRLFGSVDAFAPPGPSEEPRSRRRRVGPIELITWADCEPLAANAPGAQIRLPHDRLSLLNPVDIARIIDDLSYKQGTEIIESLDDETAADTLQEMDEERQADIVEGMDQERAADILEEMAPDDAADLLADLDELQAKDLLRRMDRDDAEDVESLLAYPEESAGGTMTNDFLTVPGRFTVDDTVLFMRQLDEAPDLIDYLYVVDEDNPAVDWAGVEAQGGGRLLGIVSLRDLLLAGGDRRLSDLMQVDFVWVRVEDDRDQAARLMSEYNLVALPVLDDQDRMLGIITVDDIMEILLPDRQFQRLPRVFG